MQQTQIIMGMPITVKIFDKDARFLVKSCFDFFKQIDKRFSTYKSDSEISQINKGLPKSKWSPEMKKVLRLCEETKKLTKGYFNIEHNGRLDPSGLVKGWAIYNTSNMLLKQKINNYCIEAGGDIQVHGKDNNQPWVIGIRNPFNLSEIVKKVRIANEGVATSGTYIRGQHIYNPHNPKAKLENIKSLTVIAKNIFEADRFATAAFAMGVQGIEFIKSMPGLEGYVIMDNGMATYTSGFERYVVNA